MRRIITAKVRNRGGVLNRITGMFNKRQFNIESITVGVTEEEGISKMTFVVDVSDEQKLEQLNKQLNKQIDVIKVSDITDKEMVARELAMVKVNVNGPTRAEIQGIISPFRAIVIDVSRETLTIQVTGKPEKIEAFVSLLKPYGIKELTRTGVTALLREDQHPKATGEVTSFPI